MEDVLTMIFQSLSRIERSLREVLVYQRCSVPLPKLDDFFAIHERESRERRRRRAEKIANMTPEERAAMEARKQEGIRKCKETMARKKAESLKKAEAIRELAEGKNFKI